MLSKASTAARAAVIITLVTIGSAGGTRQASAADLGGYAPPPAAAYGVDCEGTEVKTFPGVILGHFSGGTSQYSGPGGRIVLDWHDEKLCFPSRRTCDRWVAGLRHDFHRPAGYFTCLIIR